jgi:uncharacterized membrane protein YfcA
VLPAALAIFLVAAVVQAVSGFGFALVATPLLAMVAGPQHAVIASSLVSLAMNLGMAWAEREHVQWRASGRLLGWACLGMPVGLVAFRLLNPATLATAIAVVVLGCTLLVWRGWRISAAGWSARAVGVLAGVLTTSTGTNGPPLVAAVQGMGVAPRVFRATMAVLLAGAGFVGIASLAASGAVGSFDVSLAAAGLPVALLGGWAGRRIVARVNPLRFRQIVLSALVASSAVALVHATF